MCFLGRRYLYPELASLSHIQTHSKIQNNSHSHQRTNITLPPPTYPSQIPTMPKGGSGRDEHHCPQRSHGNCRWAHHPVRYCTTHSEMCPFHDLPHQTYQSCTKCEGERRAAERALREYQVSNSTPGDGQQKKYKGKERK